MRGRLAGLMELAAALAAGAWFWWVWPRAGLAMVGAEQWWVGLGIVVVMGGAGLAEALGWSAEDEEQGQVHLLTPQVCKWASWGLIGLGIAGVGVGRWVGNYKLWVAVGYLLGMNFRMAGVVVALRPKVMSAARPALKLVGAAAAAAAGVELATAAWLKAVSEPLWPPGWGVAGEMVARAGLWGVVCGALAAMAQRMGARRGGWWMGYTAMAFGPGPVFAAMWIKLPWLMAVAALAGGLGVWAWMQRGKAATGQSPGLGAYWLLRAMMLMWWGLGIALAIAGGWWQGRLVELLLEAKWIRAIVLGGVLVSCAGLLAEYSLPLLGGPMASPFPAAQRKVLGMIMSAGAVVVALVPLGLLELGPPPAYRPLAPPRAVVLRRSVVLDEKNPMISMEVPSWLRGVSRVYVISHLEGAGAMMEGEAVARVVASDTEGRVYVFALRVGIDTAERDLARMGLSPAPVHESPRIYASWMAYTPAGQPFYAHDYITGLYLGHRVAGLKEIEIARLKDHKGLRVVLKRVMIY